MCIRDRIKIIVKLYAIYIVFLNDFLNPVYNIIAHPRIAGIHINGAIVREGPVCLGRVALPKIVRAIGSDHRWVVARFDAQRVKPVSYTHLDVYKRQAVPLEEGHGPTEVTWTQAAGTKAGTQKKR